jgi:hypothetical protein
MQLTLKYTPNKQHASVAALIKGSSPGVWLQQLSQWGIAVNQADYFILPQSINSTVAAGLFVVFKNAEQVKNIEIIHPYGKIGENLFLPTNAVLYPEVTEADLKRALLWTYQLYHPTIGLVGFEDSDKANPLNWVDYGNPVVKSWGFANQGLPPTPPLQLIQVQPPTAADVLNDVKKDIDKKPLSDIGKDDKRSTIAKIGDLLTEGLLKGILITGGLIGGIVGGLFSFLDNSGSGYKSNTGRGGDNSKPLYNHSSGGKKEGFFAKLGKRIEEKIADLEERRANELNRLMKMFDENSDEALQYALPLDSPYLNRGQKPEGTGGWLLARRLTNFNLGGLGGGNVGNTWYLGNNEYQSLRTKYLAAAQREIEKKDYKKAAYIYAHLLADFSSAANVLEQGKYYREAAALYKDHLKNKESAAQCLERGGLTLDAIELYKEMDREEKVGDLYKSIGQTENAAKHYEIYIGKKLDSTDYIDAARVVDAKLENPQRAKDILLDGWKDYKNAENCLKNYFDIEAREDNAPNAVKKIYNNHTDEDKKSSFLNVLEHVNKQHPDGQLLNASRDIAFEIVSAEAARHNPGVVKQLKTFFPDDSLLPSDSSRFLTKQNQQLVNKTRVKEIELAGDTDWVMAVAHHHQFIVFGYKDKIARMARGNWYGNVEYYFWNNKQQGNPVPIVISNALFSNTIIVAGVDGITRKELFKNKYFSEVLNVEYPAWLETDYSNIAYNDRGELYRLKANDAAVTLYHYDKLGNVSRSVNCTQASDALPITFLDIKNSSTMVYHAEYLYNFNSRALFSVSLSGQIRTFPTDAGIRLISSYINNNGKLILIVSTNLACFVAEAENGNITFFTDTYFGSGTAPQFMVMLTLDVIVTARKSTIHVYNYNNGYPTLKNSIETSIDIVSIIKSSGQNQIAVLGNNKQVTLINIE